MWRKNKGVMFLLMVTILYFTFVIFSDEIRVVLMAPIPFNEDPRCPLPTRFLFVLTLCGYVFIPRILYKGIIV